MKYPSPLLVALLAAVVVLGACGGRTAPTSPSDRTPSWVNALISQYEAAPVANPPRSI